MRDKHQVIEEPCEFNGSCTVLKSNGSCERVVDFTRACQDAIQQIRVSIERKPKYVLDADIKGCFDKIDHQALLKKLEYKGKVRQQIKAWLKSGVIDNKTFLETEEGTPQGGVCSPLLANIALHGLENHLNEFAKTIDMRRPDGRRQEGWQMKVQSLNFIRYADDFLCATRCRML